MMWDNEETNKSPERGSAANPEMEVKVARCASPFLFPATPVPAKDSTFPALTKCK